MVIQISKLSNEEVMEGQWIMKNKFFAASVERVGGNLLHQ